MEHEKLSDIRYHKGEEEMKKVLEERNVPYEEGKGWKNIHTQSSYRCDRYINHVGNAFVECFPFNLISGLFIVIGSFLISKIECSELIKIAIVMIINSFCYQIANYIFTILKHNLRIKLCKRLNIEPTEQNIAVMESLEYQSV